MNSKYRYQSFFNHSDTHKNCSEINTILFLRQNFRINILKMNALSHFFRKTKSLTSIVGQKVRNSNLRFATDDLKTTFFRSKNKYIC